MNTQRFARTVATRLEPWLDPLLATDPPTDPRPSHATASKWPQAWLGWQYLAEDIAPQAQAAAELIDDDGNGKRKAERRRLAIESLSDSLSEVFARQLMLRDQVAESFGLLPSQPLTVYRIRDGITDFEAVLRRTPAQNPALQALELRGDFDFEARLYVVAPDPRLPDWMAFLAEGFEDFALSPSAANQALLVVRVTPENDLPHLFALTFGMGRFLLAPHCHVRHFGLKVSLNLIFEGDEDKDAAQPRIRRVDMTTVTDNVMRTRRQANRHDDFDAFGVDIRRDLLGAVTGDPVDSKAWGNRITGGDALRLGAPVTLPLLGELCIRLHEVEQRDDYTRRFDWIDNLHPVEDKDRILELQGHLAETLRGDPHKLELAPPSLLDWDEIASFSLELAPPADESEADDEAAKKEVDEVESHRFDELYLEHYLEALGPEGLATLDVDRLTLWHQVHAFDAGGKELGRWPVFDWLDGEIEHAGETYALVGGELFRIEKRYLSQLDTFISRINEWSNDLPDSPKGQAEGDYNRVAAESSEHLLCLDAKTVRVDTHTSPIEVCDLLSSDGDFVHVKRKFRSSALSHLFGQGAVSGDLFRMNPQFRQKTLDLVKEEERQLAETTGDPEYQGRFSRFGPGDVNPNRYEVVYAIIAPWKGRKPSEALPFFSKVNLRRHVDDLHRMGYKVSYKRIEEV